MIPAEITNGTVNQDIPSHPVEVAAITGHPFSSFAEAWERYPPDHVRAVGIEISRETLAERIAARVEAMLEAGLLEEIAGLVERGLGSWLTATQAIGYAEFARHLADELTLAEAIAGTVKRTRSLARRQTAWFARDPRIRWVPVGEGGGTTAIDVMLAALTEERSR